MRNVRDKIEIVFAYDAKTKANAKVIKHPSGVEVKVFLEDLQKRRASVLSQKGRIEKQLQDIDKDIITISSYEK